MRASNRKRHRKDANHDPIQARLEELGWYCQDTSQTNLGYDIIAARDGRLELVEIKDGDLPPSRQDLTQHEARVMWEFAQVGVTVRVLRSVADAEGL